MADYYPLIARAVAGLEKNTGDGRRALYERARAALVAQLRGATPRLDESEVTRERLALEEAIRKVEAEYARKSWVEPIRADPIPKMRANDFPAWDEEMANDAPVPPSRRPAPPPSPRQQPAQRPPAMTRPPAPRPAAAPGMLGDQRYVDPVFDQPIEGEADIAPETPPRHPLRSRSATARRPLLDSGVKDFREGFAEPDEPGVAPARSARSSRDSYAAADDAVDAAEQDAEGHASESRQQSSQDYPAPRMLEPSFTVEEPLPGAQRPRVAPSKPRDRNARPSRSFREIVRVVMAFLMLGCFVGFAVWQWPTVMALYRLLRAPATTTTDVARDTSPSARKIQERLEDTQAGISRSGVGTAPGVQAGTAAVAQRVVLYEEDPNNPAGQRFVGSAIWRTETVTPGPGQKPEIAIRADVEIPERKIALTWSLQRNTQSSLPASHTVEVEFKLPPDFPFGGVTNVPGILAKQNEQTKGMPLAGLSVTITAGRFLIGLSAVEADKERNIQLLKERDWFDIPLVYDNKRRAILAIEKGVQGERVFEEAFRAWGQ